MFERFIAEAPVLDEGDERQEEIATNFNHAMNQYIAYWEFTWIGQYNPRTKARRRPLYSIDLWNKREEALNQEELTTNSSESWNSVSKKSLPMKPSIWVVFDTFKKEDAMARSKLVASVTGNSTDPNPGRTKKIALGKEKLRKVVVSYEKVGLDDWMNTMTTLYQ